MSGEFEPWELPTRRKGFSLYTDPQLQNIAQHVVKQAQTEAELGGLQVYKKYVQIGEGTHIEVYLNHGQTFVTIYDSEDISTQRCISECLCDCGISTGWVDKSPGSTLDEETGVQTDDYAWIPTQDTKYDIYACQEVGIDVKEQALFKSMKPTDFFPHFRNLEQDSDTYFIISEHDVTIEKPDGSVEQKHIGLPDIYSCGWDKFRLTSIEYDGDIEEEITIDE